MMPVGQCKRCFSAAFSRNASRHAGYSLAGIRQIWQNELMKNNVEISEDLNRRIEMLTSRSTLTRDQIIEDALSHGRSLAWQEKWIAGVQAGIEAADRGDFANEEEIAAVLNKHSQA
jgi:predicted transcriptional regulator